MDLVATPGEVVVTIVLASLVALGTGALLKFAWGCVHQWLFSKKKNIGRGCTTCSRSARNLTAPGDRGFDCPRGRGKDGSFWNKEKKELRVYFMNKELLEKWKYNGDTMNRTNILQKANTWADKCRNVPRFVLASSIDQSDIRVKLHNERYCCSIVGSQASEGKYEGQATMWLDLDWGEDKNYTDHLIVHEFGHALGLEHEHQHSTLLKHILTFINLEKMQSDLRLSNAQWAKNWGQNSDCESADEDEYDPESIMHYWFARDWLYPEFNIKLSDVNKHTELSDEARQVLRGILIRHDLAASLSATDIRFIEAKYSKSKEPSKKRVKPDGSRLFPDGGELNNAEDEETPDSKAVHPRGPDKFEEEDYDAVVVRPKQQPEPVDPSPKLNAGPSNTGGKSNPKPTVSRLNEGPQTKNFASFPYKDQSGRRRVYKLRETFSSIWKDVGRGFGFTEGYLTNVGMRNRHNPEECFDEILSKWEGGGSVPSDAYPVTWKGLIKALRDLDTMARKVDELETALSGMQG